MKKCILILSFLCFVLFAQALAHPPSDIRVIFDASSKILTAVIVHGTSNPQGHYIKKVEVGLNAKEIIEQSISQQDNNQTQTVSYFIPDAKSGDRLSVEGYCSISGTLKKEITIN